MCAAVRHSCAAARRDQALTAEDIEALKREGKMGGWGVLFGALCINSAAC